MFLQALLLFFSIATLYNTLSCKTIILIAGGQSHLTDRQIGDYYESGLTVSFCTTLSDALKKNDSTISVIVIKESTFFKMPPFALAEEVNKKNPSLVIHIGFYEQISETPTFHFFYYGYENTCIPKNSPTRQLTWTNINDAHKINCLKSEDAAQVTHKNISTYVQQGLYECKDVKRIPFRRLKGILSPNFACEIGICANQNSLKKIIDNLTEALIASLKKI